MHYAQIFLLHDNQFWSKQHITFQLATVIYGDPNTYGSIFAFIIGFILRLGGGEPFFKLKPFIYYPGGTNFPFKTFAMFVSLITLWTVSYLAKYLFVSGCISPRFDILQCNLANGGRSLALKKVDKSVEKVDTESEKTEMEKETFETDLHYETTL